MDNFGERLRYLRKAKGLTQKELAKLLNLESSSTISQYETLNCIPDVHILQNMAHIFDCSLDYLLARSNELKEAYYTEFNENTIKLIEELDPNIIFFHINAPQEFTDEEEKEKLKIFIQSLKTKRRLETMQ